MTVYRGPSTYTGTPGAALVAPAGSVLVTPTGSAVYANGNLDGTPGSCAQFNARALLNTTAAYTDDVSHRFRFTTQAPASGAVTISEFVNGSSGLARMQIASTGKLQLTGGGSTVSSVGVFSGLGTAVFWAVFRKNGATQSLYLYTAAGVYLEKLTTDALVDLPILRHNEGPTTSGATITTRTDDSTIADGFQPVDGSWGLESQWIGRPTDSGFTAVVHGKFVNDGGPTAARITAKLPDETVVAVSPTTTFTAENRAFCVVSGLSPATQYGYMVELRVGGDWFQRGPALRGKVWTLQTPGRPRAEARYAPWGCAADSGSNNVPAAFDDMIAWNPHTAMLLGDWDYADDNSSDPAVHRASREAQIVFQDGLQTLIESVVMDYACVSDHDGGAYLNSIYNDPSIATSLIARKQIAPMHDLPVAGTWAHTWIDGRVRHIALDTRSNSRDDPQAPHSPSKSALGLAQRAWLLDLLAQQDLDGTVFAVVHSDFRWYGPTPAVLGSGKPDIWPYYPDERGIIGAAMLGKRGVIWQGDNHGGFGDDGSRNPAGDWPLLGPCGIVRGTGNAPNDESIYQHWWPPFGVIQDIRIYGRCTIRDTGSLVTADMVLRDGAAGVDRFTVSKSWTVPAPPRLPHDPYFADIMFGGQGLDRPALGRDVVTEDISWLAALPATTRMQQTSGRHGARTDRTVYGIGQFVVPVDVVGETTADFQVAYGKLLSICRPTRATLRVTRFDGSVRTCSALARHPFEPLGDIVGGQRVAVVFDVVSFWQDTADRTVQFDVLADGALLELAGFESATAPLVDLIVEVRGPLTDMQLEPVEQQGGAKGRSSFEFTADIGSRTLRINTATGGVWFVTPAGEITASVDWAEVRHTGSPYLLEIPAGTGSSAPSVRIYGTAIDAAAFVRFIGRQAYLTP